MVDIFRTSGFLAKFRAGSYNGFHDPEESTCLCALAE